MLSLQDCSKLCDDAGVLEECRPILSHTNLESAKLRDSGLYSWICETLSSGLLMCSLYNNYGGLALNSKEYIVSVAWAHAACLLNPETETCPDVLSYRSAVLCESHLAELQNDSVNASRVISNVISLSTGRPRTLEGELLFQMDSLSKTLYKHKQA